MNSIEGQIRIPSGCAIAAVISKDGNRLTGEKIVNSMKPMHDRSNGLGGGFAAYGIYPEYRDFYALHMFFNDRAGMCIRDSINAELHFCLICGNIRSISLDSL